MTLAHRLYVGTIGQGVFRSLDGGASFARVTSLLADPDEPGTVWAGVEIDGLFRSRDLGRSWERVGQGLSSQDIHALAKISARTMLAATNNDLNVSHDAGLTWQGLNIGKVMPWAYCRTLAQLPGRRETVLLGNGDGPPGTAGAVGISQDGGATWQRAFSDIRPNGTVWSFACHASDPNLVYGNSVNGQVFRSVDRGQTWQKLAREFGEIRALAWTP